MRLSKLMFSGMLLLLAVGVFANDTREKMVEEMLELSGTPETLKQITDQIMQMQADAVKEQAADMPVEKKEKLLAFQKKITQKVMDFISWESMKSDYIKLYADVYTEEELKALIDFLKSPVGQKMVKKSPQVAQKAMVMMQQKMQVLMPELEQMSKEFAEDMKMDEAGEDTEEQPAVTPADPAAAPAAPEAKK